MKTEGQASARITKRITVVRKYSYVVARKIVSTGRDAGGLAMIEATISPVIRTFQSFNLVAYLTMENLALRQLLVVLRTTPRVTPALPIPRPSKRRPPAQKAEGQAQSGITKRITKFGRS